MRTSVGLKIPEQLQNLSANCGVFAVWMVLQQHQMQVDIAKLIQICRHDDEDGTFGIGLAVALWQLGFAVTLHSDEDLHLHEKELYCYAAAKALQIPIVSALSYQHIQAAVAQGKLVIVYYDTLQGIGNHSLVYSINAQEICFFDNFDAMSATVFEQQRQAEGVCRQAIVIGQHYGMRC